MVSAVLQIIHFGESAIEGSTKDAQRLQVGQTRNSLHFTRVYQSHDMGHLRQGDTYTPTGEEVACLQGTGYTLATSPSSQGPNLQSAVLPTSTLTLFRSMLWILLTLIIRFFHIWGHIHLDQIDPGRYLPPRLLPSNLLCPSRVCAAHRWIDEVWNVLSATYQKQKSHAKAYKQWAKEWHAKSCT